MYQLTPAQKSKIKKQEERRRRKLRRREDEYRRRIVSIRAGPQDFGRRAW